MVLSEALGKHGIGKNNFDGIGDKGLITEP